MNTDLKLALSLTVLSLSIACGPTDDPSKNNNNNTVNNNPVNNNTANNNPVNNNTANNNTVPPNNNTVPPNNNTVPPNNNTNTGPCVVNDMYFGQITSESDEHAGGAPSTDPLATDAGLGTALAMFTAMEEMEQVVDIDIAGATVIATNFGTGGNSNFWVEDSGGAMQVFLGFMNPVGETVKVGDVVSFKITSFNNFDGHPQIATIEGFTIDSSGNAVPYTDLTGMAPAATDYNTNVRIGGRLGTTGTACGGDSMCYDLVHDGQTIEYRTDSDFIEGGECVTFFGPLSGFPGPNADSGNAIKWQLDVKNYTWSWEAFDN